MSEETFNEDAPGSSGRFEDLSERSDGAKDPSTRDGASRARRAALFALASVYALLWMGGVAQHFLGEEAKTEYQGLFAALFLALAGSIALVGAKEPTERALLSGVALLGFLAEVSGVRFGFPFGEYVYTDALGPRLFGVPLVMTAAWMTLAAYVKQMLSEFRLAAWAEVLIGAAWITAFDLLIDPLAANQLGYWRWANEGNYFGVPATNFAGWFGVSLLAFLVMRKRFARDAAARLTGLSILLFFTLIAFAHGSLTVGLIGAALCATHILVASRARGGLSLL